MRSIVDWTVLGILERDGARTHRQIALALRPFPFEVSDHGLRVVLHRLEERRFVAVTEYEQGPNTYGITRAGRDMLDHLRSAETTP